MRTKRYCNRFRAIGAVVMLVAAALVTMPPSAGLDTHQGRGCADTASLHAVARSLRTAADALPQDGPRSIDQPTGQGCENKFAQDATDDVGGVVTTQLRLDTADSDCDACE